MGKARRKQIPEPPKWFHYDTDGCWLCENRNACGGCRLLVREQAIQRKKKNKTREIHSIL